MSHAASNYVKHLVVGPKNGKPLTPAEKAIVCLLADDHNEEDRFAFPSVGNLAKRACMTDVHCRRLLRSLEEKGVIECAPNLNARSGGRTSNRYRFPEIDPPFDPKWMSATHKNLQLQAALRAQRPVQTKLEIPPNTDVRGGQTTVLGGGEHGGSGGANTDVGPPRTPMLGLESLEESLRESPVESSAEPGTTLPSVPEGGAPSWSDSDRFVRMKLQLHEDLCSVPAGVAAAKRFREVVPGTNDFDACFREWWLDGVKRLPHGVVIETHAMNEAATEEGLAKYRGRLQRLARRYFQLGEKSPVTFRLLRPAEAAGAPAAERPASAPPPAFSPQRQDTPDVWELAKARIAEELVRAGDADGLKNYADAIAATKLLATENARLFAVWKIRSAHPRKTRAVLQALDARVKEATRLVAGCVVQLLVM